MMAQVGSKSLKITQGIRTESLQRRLEDIAGCRLLRSWLLEVGCMYVGRTLKQTRGIAADSVPAAAQQPLYGHSHKALPIEMDLSSRHHAP